MPKQEQNKRNNINNFNTQQTKKQMKKNYTSPAIETTEILVEQGIAQSTVTLWYLNDEPTDNRFGLGNATYEETGFDW